MTAVIAEHESNEVVEFRAPGPGERLKNARLAKDIEISKMAETLHLTTDMVEALECDDYSEMPARVFVRGYIRNYARAVELPGESVLSQFDQLWPEDEGKVVVNTAPRLPADSRPGRSWPRLITWLVVLSGFGLFLLWWAGHLDQFTEQLAASRPASTSQEPAQPIDESALRLPGQAVEQMPSVSGGVSALSLPEPAAPAEAPAQAAAPAEAAAPVAAEQPAPAPVEPVAAPAVAPAESSAEPSAGAAEPAAPVAKIRFTEDCWVNIRDSSGEFKLFGTLRKGSERTLGGSAPYRMVLGNAQAVELLVDGQPFDLRPHTRDNIARLSFTP